MSSVVDWIRPVAVAAVVAAVVAMVGQLILGYVYISLAFSGLINPVVNSGNFLLPATFPLLSGFVFVYMLNREAPGKRGVSFPIVSRIVTAATVLVAVLQVANFASLGFAMVSGGVTADSYLYLLTKILAYVVGLQLPLAIIKSRQASATSK